jgi:hypothetical protein
MHLLFLHLYALCLVYCRIPHVIVSKEGLKPDALGTLIESFSLVHVFQPKQISNNKQTKQL